MVPSNPNPLRAGWQGPGAGSGAGPRAGQEDGLSLELE